MNSSASIAQPDRRAGGSGPRAANGQNSIRAWSPPLAIAALLLFLPAAAARAACDQPDRSVHLNQVGFLTAGTKRAIIASKEEKPVRWRLVDDAGEVRLDGMTTVFGEDAASGEHVHRVDFSDFRASGDAFRIETGCAVSHPFDIAADVFEPLKYDALSYFYHNRSGVPIDESFAGAEAWKRPAGHARDTATCRSEKDRHGNRWPGCDYTLDLTGGWYDAGDHGKYVVNGGIAVWTLANLYERQQMRGVDSPFRDGLVSIPEADNGVNDLLDEIRFQLEFMLRMQAPDDAVATVPVGVKRTGRGLEFTSINAAGMVHHKVSDERWTALPVPPHLDREKRVLAPVSTAATLNLAAVAAQCARIWKTLDESFAMRCLTAAEKAFAAAQRNPQVYFIADFDGSGAYGDGRLGDEFFWAAAELFVTTGGKSYLDVLRASPHFSSPLQQEPAWPRVAGLGVVSLALLSNELRANERRRLRRMILAAADRFSAERARSGYHIPYSGSRYPWGSNSNVLNRAIILALAFDFSRDIEYRSAVTDALDYLLGRNPLDRSFVSGYGERPMQHPHHRFWAPSFDTGLPPPPPGALSGGPNNIPSGDEVARKMIEAGCAPQTCWVDDVRSYSMNEVAINWNAPLVWVSAFIDEPAP